MGRNNADFQGVELHHEIHPGGTDIEAHLNGNPIGWLQLDETGRVEDIQVDEKHQGKGVGKAMWRHAEKLHQTGQTPNPPKHSDYRTYDGEFFARSVGGHLPRNTAEWLQDYPKDHIVRSYPND
jgi:GNAT superfamily N-acetyltransferase